MIQTPKTFWERLTVFTPIVCRLLARHPHGPPLTSEEIAERAGMPVYSVVKLGEMLSWDNVPVGDLRAFTRACGMDFENARDMKRVTAYLRAMQSGKIGRKFGYLERSPDYKTLYLPLRVRYEQSRSKS